VVQEKGQKRGGEGQVPEEVGVRERWPRMWLSSRWQ